MGDQVQERLMDENEPNRGGLQDGSCHVRLEDVNEPRFERHSTLTSQDSAFSQEDDFSGSLGQVGLKESSMFPEHEGYHHCINTKEATKRLKQKAGRHYLTRYSKSQKCYILSVNQNHPTELTKHYIIERDVNQKYKISGKEKNFDTIESLLEHYESNSIGPELKNIGKKYTEDDYTRDQHANSQGCCTVL